MLKKVEVFTLALLIVFALYCAITIGSSWDEIFEMRVGKERFKYLFSFGSYKYFDFYNSRFYPGFYNTLAIFVSKMFPIKYEIEIWHLTNTVFSILSIVGIYKITSNLFNKKVGKIVFLLCFINPIFFGHMAMNSKDTIIVFANVWSTYVFLRYMQNQNFSNKRNRYVLLGGLAVGFGTGVRLPFIATLFPLIIFFLLDKFFFKKICTFKFSIKKFAFDLTKVLIIAYLITISTWPHVHNNIFIEPFKIFIDQTSPEAFGVNWLLLNGNFVNTSSVPKLYILINFFYKSPEFILLCYLIFIYLIATTNKYFLTNFKSFWTKIFLILFIFLFPNIFLIFLPYKIYDGLRLFLYLVPYFNIIPGLVIYYLIYNTKLLKSKFVLGFVASLFIYYIFIFSLLTPYQYTYLNSFIGKYSKAHEKFENDYWAVSIKELISKIPDKTDLVSNNTTIKIAFCGVPHNAGKKELNKIKNLRYEQKDLYAKDIDYIIMTNRIDESSKDNSLEGINTCYNKFRGKEILLVKRNGLVLSTIKKLK